MGLINHLGLASQTQGDNAILLVATTAIATTLVLIVLRSFLWPTQPKVVRSPLRTVLPRLSQAELNGLEYTPDSFPGARDVETPYGSIRVYEWGPPSGDKVVFVHGISTSCMTLTKLAKALVEEKGCRVLLFDLFGRGFSDNPADLPHDARLYTTQILIALASSPNLSWTGPQAFKLVGYSLGGGIAVQFATSFPHLVSSLVLLAPAGLIRPKSFGALTRAVYTSGAIPPRLLAWPTSRRLRKPIRPSGEHRRRKAAGGTTSKPDPVTASLSEAIPPNNGPAPPTSTTTPLEQRVLRAVHWQLAHHAGFVSAFLSCIRHGPLLDEHGAWAKLAGRAPGTTAVILGEDDDIIDAAEYAADGLPLAGGGERVRWSVVSGGHDFPMTNARGTLREMGKAWEWE